MCWAIYMTKGIKRKYWCQNIDIFFTPITLSLFSLFCLLGDARSGSLAWLFLMFLIFDSVVFSIIRNCYPRSQCYDFLKANM